MKEIKEQNENHEMVKGLLDVIFKELYTVFTHVQE